MLPTKVTYFAMKDIAESVSSSDTCFIYYIKSDQPFFFSCHGDLSKISFQLVGPTIKNYYFFNVFISIIDLLLPFCCVEWFTDGCRVQVQNFDSCTRGLPGHILDNRTSVPVVSKVTNLFS